ncbi:Uncharacterised protein [Mycolicibacterium fortuitum]|uniref:Uncharacterized protein n=1 Tax=Mycolicibacterium fortuitum TaxID=1766 RepID=A0A378UUZ8_MYCFO|nr:Uncharacterised protein [Mycolicibacterium fortuitum]
MISNTPTATNTAINSTSPMIAATDVGLYLCLGRGLVRRVPRFAPSPVAWHRSDATAGFQIGCLGRVGSGGSAVMS